MMRRTSLMTAIAVAGVSFGIAACVSEPDSGDGTKPSDIITPVDTNPGTGGTDKGGTKPPRERKTRG
jgi:hypothetical protein